MIDHDCIGIFQGANQERKDEGEDLTRIFFEIMKENGIDSNGEG